MDKINELSPEQQAELDFITADATAPSEADFEAWMGESKLAQAIINGDHALVERLAKRMPKYTRESIAAYMLSTHPKPAPTAQELTNTARRLAIKQRKALAREERRAAKHDGKRITMDDAVVDVNYTDRTVTVKVKQNV
jgi:hypothetical protein